MRPVLRTVLVALVLAACTSQPAASPSLSPSPTVPASPASGSPEPSVGATATAAPSTSAATGGGVTVSGTFASDSIEGGCAYLESADGIRYEVLWPDGWTLLRDPFRLQDPSGDIVATGGETITVRGQEATDMASICMIGPIFRATEVVTIDR